MSEISILAIDLAKGSFQVCGVTTSGAVVFNRSVSRTRLLQLLGAQEPCIVAMEACATSHRWGRIAQSHGHEARLIPATYVKPFVKRQKNDHADAEAFAETRLGGVSKMGQCDIRRLLIIGAMSVIRKRLPSFDGSCAKAVAQIAGWKVWFHESCAWWRQLHWPTRWRA